MEHSPAFLAIVNDAKKRVKECTVDDVKKRLDRGEKLTLIDTREESEFAAGHVPGALHLSKGVIERDIEAKVPDKAAPLVLYCGGGFRPHDYSPDRPVPTILFLHGLGQTGTDGERQARVGLGRAIRDRESTFPFLVVFPQAQKVRPTIVDTWFPDRPEGARALAIL